MSIQKTLKLAVQDAFKSLFDTTIDAVEFQATRRDFEGDITIVVFPFLRQVKTNPVDLANKLGDYLKKAIDEVEDFNVVKGFI